MSKLNERVAALEERLKQLKAKQQQADARKRAFESRQARKNDTRRKMLAGAIVLAKVEQGVLADTQFRKWLDEALTRVDDRALLIFHWSPRAKWLRRDGVKMGTGVSRRPRVRRRFFLAANWRPLARSLLSPHAPPSATAGPAAPGAPITLAGPTFTQSGGVHVGDVVGQQV